MYEVEDPCTTSYSSSYVSQMWWGTRGRAMVGVDSSTPYSAAGMKSHHSHWPTPKALDATKMGAIATKIAKYPRL